MNTDYLNTLPEVKNKFKVDLMPGEKVIFTAKPWGFSTDEGFLLGDDKSRITMTNQRIIADNGAGIWTADIEEDIVEMHRDSCGKFLMKQDYILVMMNAEIAYGIGIHKMKGFRFHFRKKDMAKFEEIISHMA